MCDYFHIVPWYNSLEWNNVYDLIYSVSSSLVTRKQALNDLLIWKARCPSLPSGIESTLTLLEVQIQDIEQSTDFRKEQVLRLALSTAIMRFVNHMLETETARGPSLYEAARTKGIPDWIVDLRHDTAHGNNLPSIELLKEACSFGMEWLQLNYWEKHKLCICDYLSGQNVVQEDPDEENKMAALMTLCISLSICSKCKVKHLAAIPDINMVEQILSDARDLFGEHIGLSKLKSISILSLINTMNMHVKKVLKTESSKAIFIKLLVREDSLFFSFEILNFLGEKSFYKKGKLSSDYVLCLEVLLTFLHTNDLLLDFIMELIKVTQNNENSRKKCTLAALWISEILKGLLRCQQFMEKRRETTSGVTRKELKQLFYHWFPNIKSKGLILDLLKPVPEELTNINYLQPIISTYNPHLTYFIKDLLSLVKPSLPNCTTEKICKLALLIACPEKFPWTPDRIYTVEDLNKNSDGTVNDDDSDCIEFLEESVEILTNDSKKPNINGIWKLASGDLNWSKCPLGKLPWPNNMLQTNVAMEIE